MRTKSAMTVLFVVLFLFMGCSKTSEDQAQTMERYENGWPTFWISYPSDWIQKQVRLDRGEVISAVSPTGIPSFRVAVNLRPPALLKYFSRSVLPALSTTGDNIHIIEDKAFTLKDGREAWETRIDWDPNNGPSLSTLFLATKKEDFWITVSVSAEKGKLTNDLKAIPYSLEVYPEKELPIDLPEDLDRFIQEFNRAQSEHNLERSLSLVSDDFKNKLNGGTKADVEKEYIWLFNSGYSMEKVPTKYKIDGDTASIVGYQYIAGSKFPCTWQKLGRTDDGRWLIIGFDG